MTDPHRPFGLRSGDRVRSKSTPKLEGIVQCWLPQTDWRLQPLVLVQWTDAMGWGGETPVAPETLERIEQ